MAKGGATAEFLAEAQEIVDALNRELIAAEQEARGGDVDPDRVNGLFRNAHSLKGISSMFSLSPVSHLAHELETVLDSMRLGKVSINADALDVLFACVEKFGTLIDAAGRGAKIDEQSIEELLARLRAVAVGGEEKPSGLMELVDLGEDVLSVLTEYEEHRLRENVKRGRKLFILRSAFDLSNFDVGLAEIDAAIKKVGEVITKLPSSKPTDPNVISFDILVGSDTTAAELTRALGDERVEVVPVGRRAMVAQPGERPHLEPAGEEAAEPDAAGVRSVSRTVRVDIRRLDRLMNLVGELGLTKLAFQRLSEVIRRQQGFSELAAELHKESRNLERRLSELQAGIMEVRMVPLANLFERMVRAARKVSRELGREVRIIVSGETTELDKLIVEELADPLMHLVRNAIDHGIEPPDARAAQGKSRDGLVRLSAAAMGNHVLVEVQDDGRGIDVARTLEVAVEKGLVTPERAHELNRREAFNLLFLPGFSTRASVSEYSGRGVGMDVVKTKIAELSGVIDVDSAEGMGTTVSLTLPITLAIIPALIVQVARHTYAIPLNNVQETLWLTQVQVRTIEGRQVLSLRGSTVPLIDLRHVFGLKDEQKSTAAYAVIVGVGHNRIALAVDNLVGQQDIVIKSLGNRLRQVSGIAGAAELGGRKTILVLDMVELLNEMMMGAAAPTGTG